PRAIAREVVAGWLRVTQPQPSRLENGPSPKDLERLTAWARLLDVPEHLLWFRLPETGSTRSVHRVDVSLGRAQADNDDLAALQSLRTAARRVGGGFLLVTVTSYL